MALKPCRTCGKEVAEDAKRCPHCGQINPAPSAFANGLMLGCLGLFAMFALWCVGSSVTRGARGSPAELSEADAACENRIRDRYRLTSQARFPYRDPRASVQTADNRTFFVQAEAEIPNAFGALQRRRYMCQLERVGDSWEWRGGGIEGAR
jgi:hypothetical protein